MEAQERARRTRRKVLWCSQKGRLVAVEFGEVGPPFSGWELEILSCSALDPPNAIHCDQRCLDPSFRREIWRGWAGDLY